MKKREADFSIIMRHYIKAHPLAHSCPIEVKDTRGKDSLAFSELKEEQINSAMASKSDKGNLVRVASGTIGAGDYAYFRNAPAPLFIHYPKYLIIIDIETFVMERDRSKRKSLTLDRALEICIKSVKI